MDSVPTILSRIVGMVPGKNFLDGMKETDKERKSFQRKLQEQKRDKTEKILRGQKKSDDQTKEKEGTSFT